MNSFQYNYRLLPNRYKTHPLGLQQDNATLNANIGNPVWDAMGKPTTEVYIPNDTSQPL